MVGASAASAEAPASSAALQVSTRRCPRSSASAPAVSSAVARPRLIPLSAQASPATPAWNERALSVAVTTNALKTAVTSSVPAAAIDNVRAELEAVLAAGPIACERRTAAASVVSLVSIGYRHAGARPRDQVRKRSGRLGRGLP